MQHPKFLYFGDHELNPQAAFPGSECDLLQ